MQTQQTIRKTFLFVIVLTTTIYSGYCQQLNWRINGNSGIKDTNFLGTYNDAALKIRTFNKERMIVTNHGNVGIGTSTPSNNLDIFSTSATIVGIKSDTGNAALYIDRGDANDNSSVVYQTDGNSKWQSGLLGTENFTIKNLDSNSTNSFIVQNATSYIGSASIASNWFALCVNNGKVQVGLINDDARFSVLSFDNNASTRIARFLSNNKAQGIAIGSNSVWADGSDTNVVLNLKSKGNGKIGFYQGSTERANINSLGDLQLDLTNSNNGEYKNGALRFGSSSTEAIASKRTTGGNQYGLDFYTGGAKKARMMLSKTGKLGLAVTTAPCLLTLGYNSACKPGSSKWQVSSDRRLKSNVVQFNDGLNVIEKINPVWFNYNGKAELPTDERFAGTIAQDLQEVAPYMVKDWTYTTPEGTEENYLAVDYSALDFVVVNAIKELKKDNDGLKAENTELKQKVDALESRLNQFENALSQCCGNNSGNRNAMPNQQMNQPSLEQNQPNPFNQRSVIKCYIPSMKSSAQIMVYDELGKAVRTFNISITGYNEVVINAGELSVGSYSYSLIIDGEKTATRQMVITK